MRNFLLIALLIISTTLFSQSIERQVISSTGNFYSNAAGQLSTTLGEIVIATVGNGTNDLTQGFQQTNTSVTNVNDLDANFEMNVFPNPVADFITIQIQQQKKGISYALYTLEGKMLMNDEINELETTINIGHLAKGFYFLKVTKKNKLIKTYKVLKQ